MPFEVCDKRMNPLAKTPSVTIQKRGVISLNKAAHDPVDNAKTVELLYDRDRQVMALRVTDDSSPHAYAVRNSSRRGPGQAIVSATAFTAHRRTRPAMTPPMTPEPPHTGTALFYDPFTRKDTPPMAQTVQIHLEDDLDGGPADTTLTFALDGKDYEIDLSDANAKKLREALRPFVAAARKFPTGQGRRKRGVGSSNSAVGTAAIWA